LELLHLLGVDANCNWASFEFDLTGNANLHLVLKSEFPPQPTPLGEVANAKSLVIGFYNFTASDLETSGLHVCDWDRIINCVPYKHLEGCWLDLRGYPRWSAE